MEHVEQISSGPIKHKDKAKIYWVTQDHKQHKKLITTIQSRISNGRVNQQAQWWS